MEDIMHIQSLFLTHVVSMITSKIIEKQGYKNTFVKLNDLRVSHKDDNHVKVHLDIDAEISQKDLLDILHKAGVM